MAAPLVQITSQVIPLNRDNVDTDQIIPSREMKSTGKTGFSDGLFAGWRYTEIGGRIPDPEFVLNDPRYADASILLAGSNFGCGSSREHAVWALAEYGIRAILAPSYAPIFAANCVRNGIAPIVLDQDALQAVLDADLSVTIDLPAQTMSLPGGQEWNFALSEEAGAMLQGGLDAIDLTLQQKDAISVWLEHDRAKRPWIYLVPERG